MDEDESHQDGRGREQGRESDEDSPWAIGASALKFLGLIVTCAGALALIRTGERSLFYALFMPIGLAMWGVGYWMNGRRR